MAYLRRVERVTRIDRVSNADVREAVGQEEVMEKAKRKQRAWKEKLEQMEDSRLVKKVYTTVCALPCVTCIKVHHYNHRSVNTQDCILLHTYMCNLHNGNRVLSRNRTVTVSEYSIATCCQ